MNPERQRFFRLFIPIVCGFIAAPFVLCALVQWLGALAVATIFLGGGMLVGLAFAWTVCIMEAQDRRKVAHEGRGHDLQPSGFQIYTCKKCGHRVNGICPTMQCNGIHGYLDWPIECGSSTKPSVPKLLDKARAIVAGIISCLAVIVWVVCG